MFYSVRLESNINQCNMEAFVGSWKLVSSVNFDEYMAALGKFCSSSAEESLTLSDNNNNNKVEYEVTGVPAGMRHYGNNMTTVLTFSREGDDVIMKTKMLDVINRSVTVTFRLDEELDENSVDFRLCKVRTDFSEIKIFITHETLILRIKHAESLDEACEMWRMVVRV